LSEYDVLQLCDEKITADYFQAVIQYTLHYKAVANWLTGPVRQYLNERHLSLETITLLPQTLAELINIVEAGKVNFSVASSRLLPELIRENKSPLQLAEELNLLQVGDSKELEAWVTEVINKMPEKVVEYKKGKKGLIGLFVGEVKKLSRGKADPKKVTALLQEKLDH
jgi:aspartyl-tRNA(Asn)/glutamyl-tRNA(Gln) amidotransferase subunit B